MTQQRRDSGPLRVKTGSHTRKPAQAASTQTGRATAQLAAGSQTGKSRTSDTLATQGKPTPMRTGTQGQGERRGAGAKRAAPKSKHIGLRTKFMLVLSGVTAVVMILLGMIMSVSANKYLGSQKRHDGIEIARLSAQVMTAMADSINDLERLDSETAKNSKTFIKRLEGYLNEARTWGTLGTDPSDILAVKFNLPEKFSNLSTASARTSRAAPR